MVYNDVDYNSFFYMFYHNISPEIFSINGIEVRFYGLFFALGFLLSYLYEVWIFKREKEPVSDLESLVIYLFIGMIIGARLGEVFFYNFSHFIENPLDIFKIWEGGLSSHGAAIGLLASYFAWIKIHKVKFNKYLDLIVLGIPITAAFVRIGNFFNSEVIGKPTDLPWGVVFERLNENFPRHPVQIYEALLNILIFIVLFLVYKKYYKKTPPLFLTFLFILIYFTLRFIVEFWKERYGVLENFPLSMGQVLSIIPIIISILFLIYIYKKKSN